MTIMSVQSDNTILKDLKKKKKTLHSVSLALGNHAGSFVFTIFDELYVQGLPN